MNDFGGIYLTIASDESNGQVENCPDDGSEWYVNQGGMQYWTVINDTATDPNFRVQSWWRMVSMNLLRCPSISFAKNRWEAEVESRINQMRAEGRWASVDTIIKQAYAQAGSIILEQPDLIGMRLLNATRQRVIADFDAHDNMHNRRTTFTALTTRSDGSEFDIDAVEVKPVTPWPWYRSFNPKEDQNPPAFSKTEMYESLLPLKSVVTANMWKSIVKKVEGHGVGKAGKHARGLVLTNTDRVNINRAKERHTQLFLESTGNDPKMPWSLIFSCENEPFPHDAYKLMRKRESIRLRRRFEAAD